jgi:hypothetical protein
MMFYGKIQKSGGGFRFGDQGALLEKRPFPPVTVFS